MEAWLPRLVPLFAVAGFLFGLFQNGPVAGIVGAIIFGVIGMAATAVLTKALRAARHERTRAP